MECVKDEFWIWGHEAESIFNNRVDFELIEWRLMLAILLCFNFKSKVLSKVV